MSWNSIPRSTRTRLRLACFKRDGYLCQLRYPGICTVRAEQADHIRDRAIYGDGLDNLQATCTPCNLHKGKPGRTDKAHRPPAGAWW